MTENPLVNAIVSVWTELQAPESLLSQLRQPQALLTAYFSSDPMVSAIWILLVIIFLTYLISEITRDLSVVDRLWSITPVCFAWHFYAATLRLPNPKPLGDERLLVMSALVTVWGLRLSYNFYRKGGYSSGGEDYRWQELRKKLGPLGMELLNLVFISTYQHILLLLLCTPCYYVYLAAAQSGPASVPAPTFALTADGAAAAARYVWQALSPVDVAAASLFLFFLLIETVADQQQWNFQQRKLVMVKKEEPRLGDMRDGFISSGLFRYSRHPNFFGEISLWWAVYLFSVSVTPLVPVATAWNQFALAVPSADFAGMGAAFQSALPITWACVGAVLLTMLFHFSTAFTESISVKKYPAYKTRYQLTTSRIIPWFPATPTQKAHRD